jgi:predicted Rossmann-fold nucleotide-binding protein
MNAILPHFRAKCVDDFAKAPEGSINITDYATEFQDAKRIAELRMEIGKLLEEAVSPQNAERLSVCVRKLNHESSRAAFPFRYTRFGVAMFGSARLEEGDPGFDEVRKITNDVTYESRVDIATGGGPGIMEAANLGLKDAAGRRKAEGKVNGARNYGLLVKLPFEENPNSHLDEHDPYSTFGPRLDGFADRIQASYSCEGGGGTDLENAFVYQLRQVRHLERDFPIILKRSMWGRIQEAKMNAMYHDRKDRGLKQLISPDDLELVTLVDHPDEVSRIILDHYEKWKCGVWNKLDAQSQELILAA